MGSLPKNISILSDSKLPLVSDIQVGTSPIEKELRISQERFQAAILAIKGILWTNTPEGEMQGEQTGWTALTGQKEKDYSGYGWTNVIHPNDVEPTVAAWREAVKERKSFFFEHRVKKTNGNWGIFSVRSVPVFNENGSIREWVGVHTEITQQKKVEISLKENEIHLNLVIEASELGTWELDLKSNILIYSKRFAEIFGYPNETPLHHNLFLDQLLKEDVPIRDRAFLEAKKTGILQYQCRILWKDLSIHWIESKGKAIFDEKNNPVKLLGTLRDCTEEKNYQNSILEREQKFRNLSDSMPQIIWTADNFGNINYYNNAFFRYTGLDTNFILENGWIEMIHPDERETNKVLWFESVKNGKDYLFEHRIRGAEGEYRWHLSRAIPQRDELGKINLWVGTSTDIHDIKELDVQKDFFISMASHELKTPLTTIKGYIQLLQKKYANAKDPFLGNTLTILNKQILNLSTLLTELLDLSKIKAGKLALNLEIFDLEELVLELLEETRNVYPEYTIDYSSHKSGTVLADRNRIGQVLLNILSNAVKYSPNCKRVDIKSVLSKNEVGIEIMDYGIGINKNHQKKIFERFYRVEGTQEKTFPGFGIGLFIASDIIHQHHGRIEVHSETGKGSTFSFYLPVYKS